jgi:hypothetical protein
MGLNSQTTGDLRVVVNEIDTGLRGSGKGKQWAYRRTRPRVFKRSRSLSPQ